MTLSGVSMKHSAARLFRILLPAALAAAGGCSIFPTPDNTETLYYDLGIPEPCASEFRIEVAPFSSMTNERFRMAARGRDNIIHGLEFHKWTQTPGPLLTKYLRLAYRDATETASPSALKADDLYHLGGTVLVFESDKGEAKLGLRYMISWGASGEKKYAARTVLVTEKMPDDTPGAFADAMSRAAAKVSQMILADIRAIEKTRGKDAPQS